MSIATKVQIRWLIRRDLPEVLLMDSASLDLPWCEEDYLLALRQRNCIGMVAEADRTILGCMLYELHKKSLKLIRILSVPTGNGIGRQMVQRLKDKLLQPRYKEIVAVVPESMLEAQLFFRAMEFKAVDVLRDEFGDGDDGYVFRYWI